MVSAMNKRKKRACDRITRVERDWSWVEGMGRRLGQPAMGIWRIYISGRSISVCKSPTWEKAQGEYTD